MTKQDKRCMLILYLFMLVLMGVPALTMHINTIVDELGMLSNAAVLSGRNWHTGVISTGGYYYKYGLAFFWFLPYVILDDSILIYKVCGFINAAVFSTIPVMAYYITRKYLKVEKIYQAVFAAMAASCLGDVMYYTTNMRADYMLAVLNWACLLVLLRLMHTDDTSQKSRQIRDSILLSFLSVYAFACHTRGVVAVIAVILTVLAIHFMNHKKCVHYPAFWGSMAGFLAVDKLLQILFREAIWRDQAAHGTGSKLGALRLLFTRPGLSSFVKTVIGWLYSSFTSTAGLVCLGCIVCAVMIVLILRRSQKVSPEEGVAALFGGLSFAGSFTVGILFFFNSTYGIFARNSASRLDKIVFGRYSCCAYGILVLMAVYILIRRKDLFGIRTKIVSILAYVSVFALFAWKVAPVLNGKKILRKGIGVLGVLIQPATPAMNVKKDDVSNDLLLFGAVMFLIFLIMLLVSACKKAWCLCLVSILTGIALYGYNTYIITYAQDSQRIGFMYGVQETMDSLDDIYEDYADVYVRSSLAPAKSYQVLLMDYHITRKTSQDFGDSDNLFVISKKLPKKSELSPGSYYTFDDVSYDSPKEDIVYVKGDELCSELESRGIPLTLYAEIE